MSGSFSYDAKTKTAKVIVYLGRVAGHERRRSKTWRSPTERQARSESHAHIAALLAERDARNAEKGTVAELVREWQANRTDKSPATVYRETSIVRRIIDRLGPIRLADLSARDVDGFYAWLRTIHTARGPMSDATVHHHHRVLRSILEQGVDWEMIDIAATRRARPPKLRRQPQHPPTPDGLRALMADLPDGLRVPIAVLAQTGLRRGELLGLRWSDIDWDRGVLRVQRALVDVPAKPLADKATKSGYERDVWIEPVVVALLDRWRHELERAAPKLPVDARVFPNLSVDAKGRVPMRPGWLSQAWRRHCARHGVRVRLHDLRHFYASEMLDRGVPMSAVQEQLGHRQVTTTLNIYGSRTRDAEIQARRVAGELLMPPP